MLPSSILAYIRLPLICNRIGLRQHSLLTSGSRLTPQTRRSKPTSLVSHRNLGFIQILARSAKVPAYIGGTIFAGGTYVAYKVEQASNYTSDRISAIKDFTADIFDKTGQFLKRSGTGGEAGNGNGGNSGSSWGGNGSGADTATMGATAAAVGLNADDSDSAVVENNTSIDGEDEVTLIEQSEEEKFDLTNDEITDEMLNLTRQMIEIRTILTRVNSKSKTMMLPSIVVVGSQSSGKSSVLESIVGQEFLPKGNNMVTRRPIELTLVNSPESASETVEFPALKLFNVTDFLQVQKTLFDLNMAVPASECVSNDPIHITIRSPKVPDLTLVDLPGYIQIEASDQPTELKLKIRGLCNRYLEAPNIILAISAADVDLANSSALHAAKLADPRGERTVGVITKIDLVDPETARAILLNRKYPLKMGYIGVITKAPGSAKTISASLFDRKQASGFQAYVAQQHFEFNFFKERKDEFTGTVTGSRNLKRKLMKVLEKSMSASLRPTHLAILRELEETAYRFKVEFNDRPLTPQMYLANNIDMLKLGIKDLSQNFSRGELKSLLKNELDQKVLDLLAERYWNKFPAANVRDSIHPSIEPDLRELSQLSTVENDSYWHTKLDLASSSLTKLGVGRLSTSLVSDVMVTEIINLVDNMQLANHPMARQAVEDSAKAVLKAKYYFTADQVENCIKPFKYEVEIEDREWASSRDNAVELLREEMRQCDNVQSSLKKQIGGRKLLQVTRYLEKLKSLKKTDKFVDSREALGFSKALIETGEYALFLQDRMNLLRMRYLFVKNSKKCRSKDNKYQCPEIFLDAVATKLTSTAILFLNVELLSDFYYNFPRKLDDEFFNNMTKDQLDWFAKEDPKVRKHIELQERKDLLETALSKIEGVLALRGNKRDAKNSVKWW